MVEWSDIAIFLAIAEDGSLSAAARRLGMSQPTVGRRLSALEESLGATLFIRTAQGLLPTDAGEAILENARRMNEEARAISRLADGSNRGLSGPVTLSVAEGISHLWLTPLLRDFMALYPDISVRMRVENETADIVQREADIALRLFRPLQNSLIARKLAVIRRGIFASKDYLARHGAPRDLDDLANHFIVKAGDLRQIAWRNSNEPGDLKGRVAFISNSMETTLTALRAGLGIGTHALSWAGAYPDLVRLFPEVDLGETECWIVTHEELRTSARIRVMFDFISERMIADAAIFAGEAPPRWRLPQDYIAG